ncbi:MAG: hypothetical protein ACLUGU_07205 [Alistipes shahii]
MASVAVPGYDAARLADPEACREGRSLKIPIPATPRNDALVGFACDPHAAGGFNDALHTAELSAEGSALIGGTVRLLAASGEGTRSKSATEGPDGPKMPPAACFPDWGWRGTMS